MRWDYLTAPEFHAAMKQTGVCILTMGVIEKHSEHLPLGTDYLNVHQLAVKAAEKEPAVVFPPFYFGQIYEAGCFPGTVTIEPTLLLKLVQSVLVEIGRNGFQKIIVLNGHGGNYHFLRFLAQCSLWEEKPYQLYIPTHLVSDEEWSAVLDTKLHGHACECETSVTLANYHELVKMDQVLDPPAGYPMERMKELPPTYNGIWWYSDYPNHYAGDARTASREKGEKLASLQVEGLAKYIAAVKTDQVLPNLTREFFERRNSIG